MKYPVLNEKLLGCVLKHIEEHPEEHNQNLWIKLGQKFILWGEDTECGTTACVAGWACLLSLPEDVSYMDFCKDTPHSLAGATAPNHVRNKARELLGLTPSEADILFAPSNRCMDKLEDIKSRVQLIKRLRGLGDPK